MPMNRAYGVMGDRRGGKTGICPPLEIGTMNQKFLQNLNWSQHLRSD